MDYSGEFNEITGGSAERKRVRDFDDLQQELAGNDVGRMQRFLSPEARALLIGKRSGKTSTAMTTLDLALMHNPELARAYSNAMDFLSMAENAAERGLNRLETELSNVGADIQNTLKNAATLSDGRKVFRGDNEQVWDEHDNSINPEVAAPIEWTGLEPSRSTYLEQRAIAQDLKDRIHEIRIYQTDVLGNARAELADTENPKSVDRIGEINQSMQSAMHADVKPEFAEIYNPSLSSNNAVEYKIPAFE